MPRHFVLLVAVVTLIAFASSPVIGSEDDSSYSTPEAAFAALVDDGDLPDDRLALVESTIDHAVKSSPKDGRWVMGQSLIATHRGDEEKAYKLAKKAIKLTPENAIVQFQFGNAAFNNIDNVSFINKGAVASKGKAAYERAIELDPSLIDAHVGLANFYTFAPGIAGGSVKKAREIASTLKEIDGGAAEAAALLMQIEGKEKNWVAFAEASKEAVAAADDDAKRQEIRIQLAFIQAFQAEQPEEAMITIKAIREAGIPEDRRDTINYLDGYCLLAIGDTPGAIDRFEETLRINADAKNTRYLLAGCYESSDQPLLAAKHYEEFAERFSDDDRAKAAKKKAKKLRKQAGTQG